MASTTRNTLLMAGTVGMIFALGPDPVDRHLPDVPTVSGTATAGRLAVDLVDGSSAADLEAVEAILDGHVGDVDLDWTSPHSIDEALAEGLVPDLLASMQVLANHPLVEAVEPVIDYQLPDVDSSAVHGGGTGAGYPNDPMFERQWHLREMGAPAGWANSPRGKGIIVAVVDTGVSKVEDLQGTHILKGATFVPGTRTADDDQGHGTHVAGTIAQTTDNGVGVAGIAPSATILPVKVLSRFGFGSSTWIAAGIDYAVDEGADVINLSLGGGYSVVIHNAIRKARKKGVIVVAAAGNSGRKGVGYPGALKETIGVSALGPGGTIAPYSSWGKGVDISAPGGDKTKSGGGVLQNTVDKRGGSIYAEFQGTSMASPHVAGAAAVMLSSGLTADAVERVLLDSADGGAWDEKFGHGKLNLAAALGTTRDKHGAVRFFLGVLFALVISQLAGTVHGRFARTSAAVAGVTAGGLFFLAWLPLPGGLLVNLAASSFLSWPAVLLGPSFMQFPLWLSAGIPVVVALLFGPARSLRPIALGFAAGVGTHLFHGAATGMLEPSFLPAQLGTAWLVMNGVVCIGMAMALAGIQKLEKE
jgi:serine protease